MKPSYKNLFGIVLFVFCSVSIASAGVPNTFTPGTTAKSSEVNANFNFVNYGNIVVKANGVEIGTFLGFGDISSLGGIVVLTPQGYIFAIQSDGSLATNSYIRYASTDCTGQAYLYNYQTFLGDVIKSSIGSIYYVSKTATPVTVMTNSTLSPGVSPGTFMCSMQSYSTMAFPLTPNDTSVTGVNASYSPPITIERR
jgi:hypothetical protein